MLTRPIPKTGELLPVIGLGTYQTFDVRLSRGARDRLTQVLDTLFAAGGSLVDSSPMYGRAEAVSGELIAAMGARGKAFLATKVWTTGATAGAAEMERSLERLSAPAIELMQVHNLVDWRTQLATCRAWQAEGRIKYLGVTHYTCQAFDEVAGVLRAEPIAFLQIPYNIENREAERMLLPLAQDLGVAVLPNIPFGAGGLLRRLRRHPLPGWAAELGCASWSQVCLKFLLSHPAVTCIIPGTSDPAHMAENAAAGTEPLPDGPMRERMAACLAEL